MRHKPKQARFKCNTPLPHRPRSLKAKQGLCKSTIFSKQVRLSRIVLYHKNRASNVIFLVKPFNWQISGKVKAAKNTTNEEFNFVASILMV